LRAAVEVLDEPINPRPAAFAGNAARPGVRALRKRPRRDTGRRTRPSRVHGALAHWAQVSARVWLARAPYQAPTLPADPAETGEARAAVSSSGASAISHAPARESVR
jgi:hypothetical protein